MAWKSFLFFSHTTRLFCICYVSYAFSMHFSSLISSNSEIEKKARSPGKDKQNVRKYQNISISLMSELCRMILLM